MAKRFHLLGPKKIAENRTRGFDDWKEGPAIQTGYNFPFDWDTLVG